MEDLRKFLLYTSVGILVLAGAVSFSMLLVAASYAFVTKLGLCGIAAPVVFSAALLVAFLSG